MSSRRPGGVALVIFAKEPVPGFVKTRLAREVGADRACAVYRELLALTIAHAIEARASRAVAHLELWCAPSPHTAYFRDLAMSARAAPYAQSEGDLGQRMAYAIGDALLRSQRVLLIGTDCPLLDAPRLAQAAQCLDTHDAVLGPAEDGGFVLVGARRSITFGDVRWGTRNALADTVAGFAATGVQWTALPVAWDVDELRDLERWNALRQAPAGVTP